MRFNPFSQKRGFTLVELIVVIALIGIIMLVSLPRFQRAMTDPARTASRWFLWQIPRLKQQAVTENRRYTLNIDFDGNKLSITHEAMSPEENEMAMKNGFVLPEGFQLRNVEFREDHIVAGGVTQIHFYKKGFSDRAIIHARQDDTSDFSYFIEPFLTHVKLVESYVGYQDEK